MNPSDMGQDSGLEPIDPGTFPLFRRIERTVVHTDERQPVYRVDIPFAGTYGVGLVATDGPLAFDFTEVATGEVTECRVITFDVYGCDVTLRAGEYEVTPQASTSITGVPHDPTHYTVIFAPLDPLPEVPTLVQDVEFCSGALLGTEYVHRFVAPETGAFRFEILQYPVGSFDEDPSGYLELSYFADGDLGGEALSLAQRRILDGVHGGRTYLIRAVTSESIYCVTMRRAPGEGAIGEPVTLTPGVTHAVSVTTEVESHYSFTTGSHAGTYSCAAASGTGSAPRLDVFRDAAETDMVSSVPLGPNCAAGPLDANTLYYARIKGGDDGWPLVFTPTNAYGTPNDPYVVPVGVPVAVSAAQDIRNYYVAEATGLGGYTVTLTGLQGTDVSSTYLRIRLEDGTSVASCPVSGGSSCSTKALAAGTRFVVEVYAWYNALPAFELLVEPNPQVVGALTDPVPLTYGRVVLQDSQWRPSYYAVATPPAPAAGFRVVTVGSTIPLLTVVPTAGTRSCGLAASGCVYSGLTSATPYTFETRGASETTTVAYLVSDVVALGCDGLGSTCYSFESAGAQPTVTHPATSAAPWTVVSGDAARGASAFRSGAIGASAASCFDLTLAAATAFVRYSVLVDPGTGDSFAVYVDGVLDHRITDTGRAYVRDELTYARHAGAVIRFCYEKDSGGGGTGGGVRDAVLVDDLEWD